MPRKPVWMCYKVKVPACLVLKNRKQGVEYIEIDVEEFLTSLFWRSVISLCLTLGVFTPISAQKLETNFKSLEMRLRIVSTWMVFLHWFWVQAFCRGNFHLYWKLVPLRCKYKSCRSFGLLTWEEEKSNHWFCFTLKSMLRWVWMGSVLIFPVAGILPEG